MTPSQGYFIALYVGLLLLCMTFLVLSDFLSPTVRAAVLPVTSDGFKTVLGALLGSISVMLGQERK